MKLYELSEEMKIAEQAIEDWAEEHDGDITNCPMDKIFEKIDQDRDEKFLNCGVFYKNLLSNCDLIEAQIDIHKAEIKRLAAKKKSWQNKADGVKWYIQQHLPKGKKLENETCAIGWRKSSAVLIPSGLTVGMIPDKIKAEIVKTVDTIEKSLCKKYLTKHGELVIEKGEGEDKYSYEIKNFRSDNVQIK